MMKNIEEILYTKEQLEKIQKLRAELNSEQEKTRRHQVSEKERIEWLAKHSKNSNKKDYSGVDVRQEFKDMATRQLLRMRDFCYNDNHWDDNLDSYDLWEKEQLEIRAELSTREHIPTGKEAKEYRRELALKNKGGRRSHKKK